MCLLIPLLNKTNLHPEPINEPCKSSSTYWCDWTARWYLGRKCSLRLLDWCPTRLCHQGHSTVNRTSALRAALPAYAPARLCPPECPWRAKDPRADRKMRFLPRLSEAGSRTSRWTFSTLKNSRIYESIRHKNHILKLFDEIRDYRVIL